MKEGRKGNEGWKREGHTGWVGGEGVGGDKCTCMEGSVSWGGSQKEGGSGKGGERGI